MVEAGQTYEPMFGSRRKFRRRMVTRVEASKSGAKYSLVHWEALTPARYHPAKGQCYLDTWQRMWKLVEEGKP